MSTISIASTKITTRLDDILHESQNQPRFKVWVYFTDKDESGAALKRTEGSFTVRALVRRSKIPTDWYDLPVRQAYLDQVVQAGGIVVRASRWLNAASAVMTMDAIVALEKAEFIRRLDIVQTLVRPRLLPEAAKAAIPDSADYGASFRQNHMLGADSLHAIGLRGRGVLIAFFDTGFLPTHEAFDSVTITDTWDFIHNDAGVDDEFDIGQTEHGTATLSACGGFSAGNLIGPAYGADYLLAKTEYLSQEIQVEEDNWVLAAEWADSLGADIISSSLGYSKWYTYADMDGNTAVTTIAADVAASRGILVVNSAGNQGDSPWHYITAPADGDSVMAVGAADDNGNAVAFSSYGPTYDGRLKPELMALGLGTRCASDHGGYIFKSGTSLSAPLIAGAAGLILEAIPSLRGDPMAIRERMIRSADRYQHPDDHAGNGVPNIVLAAGFGIRVLPVPDVTIIAGHDTILNLQTLAPVGEAVTFDPLDIPAAAVFTDRADGSATLLIHGDNAYPGAHACRLAAAAGVFADTVEFTVTTISSPDLIVVGPNPFTDSLRIFLTSEAPTGYTLDVFALSGELVFQATAAGSPFVWYGTNQDGEKVASGVYIIRFSADGREEKIKVFKL